MAEGMNHMNQEQLMLVDGFESLVKALGTEIPIGLAEDLAAVRNGMPMPPEMQRILAEGSMRLGQQLKDQGGMPDMMMDPSMGAMPERETMGYTVDGQTVPMTKEQYGTEMQSGNITPNMQMRPQARPAAPMQSPRPQMRR